MSENIKKEQNLNEVEMKELEDVAGGNIFDDIKKNVVDPILDVLKPTQEPVKAPLPFPQDRR